MELNTIPGYDTISTHSTRIPLKYDEVSRITSMFSDSVRWRASVRDMSELTLIEQILVLILSPPEAYTLFPNMTGNIHSLDFPEYKNKFRKPEWVRMSSILASTGLYAIIKNKVPVPIEVAGAAALLCSGVFFPPHIEICESVNKTMRIDLLLPLAAIDAQQIKVTDAEVNKCIEYVTGLFALGSTPRLPVSVHTLQPAFADLSSNYPIDQIITHLCTLLKFPGAFASVNNDVSRVFFCPSKAGLDTSNMVLCVPVGRWMFIILACSLFEFNIRMMLKHGMYISYLEPDSPDYFWKKHDAPPFDWYKCASDYYAGGKPPAPPVGDTPTPPELIGGVGGLPLTAEKLFNFYYDYNPEAAALIPVLVNQPVVYIPEDDVGGLDILQNAKAAAVLGDIWEVRNNIVECLTRVMNAVGSKKAPPLLAKKICTRYKPVAHPVRAETPFLKQNQMLNTSFETPRYVDPGAWACVNLFPVAVTMEDVHKLFPDVSPGFFTDLYNMTLTLK